MLSAGMHRTEHRNRSRGTFRFVAPQRPFSPPAGSIRKSTPPAVIDQDRILVTAFHSPVTAAPSRSLHIGVVAPGLLLRLLPPVHIARSDLWLHYHPRFAPVGWRLLCLNPVAMPPCGSSGCLGDLHSPSGLLSPSGSQFNRFRYRKVRLPNPPDLLSLPVARIYH